MTETLFDAGPESAKLAWQETSNRVDALASGGPYRLPRWALPDNHPMRFLGKMKDELVLGPDNVLQEPQ